MREIYLDYNATTPVDPGVVESMMPYLSEYFHNPSSLYTGSLRVRTNIESAREKVAALINSRPEEIIFTGGGSEADNMAIKGIAFSKADKGKHIITSSIEHHAVLHTCKFLEKMGYEVTYLPVDKYGFVDPDELKKSIRKDTILVSVMFANNEIGTIEPIKELAQIAHEHEVLFHTDAVQAVGKIPVDVEELEIDLLSMSAHKFYGPKGVGALYMRKGVKLTPLIHGGSQEKNRRAGTENVAGIIGMGKAAEIAIEEMQEEERKIKPLRDKLEEGILSRIPEVIVNGHPKKRLYNTLNVSIKFIEGESMLALLDAKGISASSGSACTSSSLEPSHVLLAIGIPHEIAHGSLRFSLGKYNTKEDIDTVLEVLPDIVERLRRLSPYWSHG